MRYHLTPTRICYHQKGKNHRCWHGMWTKCNLNTVAVWIKNCHWHYGKPPRSPRKNLKADLSYDKLCSNSTMVCLSGKDENSISKRYSWVRYESPNYSHRGASSLVFYNTHGKLLLSMTYFTITGRVSIPQFLRWFLFDKIEIYITALWLSHIFSYV